MNKDSLKAYSELINQLWESVGKKNEKSNRFYIH